MSAPVISAASPATESRQLPRAGQTMLNIGLPLLVFAAALTFWEWSVWYHEIPPYLLPAPGVIATTLVADWGTLSGSLLVTLKDTFLALLAAVLGGVAFALLFARWRWVERSLLPFAIILQVTPIIAIAPLLVIYFSPSAAVLITSFIVAFFPILSNTLLGLASTDHNLLDLFQLSRASGWQTLIHLRLPAAVPYFLGGLRISGGLALIGAVVADLIVGKPGASAGLAYRIVESGYRSNIPRMFAALVLICLTGILIFLFFTLLSQLILGRWHDSARKREA